MKKEKKGILHFSAVFALVIFIVLGLSSTASTPTSGQTDHTYPYVGTNNVSIAAKDFTPL